jgi:hypothetical protein
MKKSSPVFERFGPKGAQAREFTTPLLGQFERLKQTNHASG